MSFPNQSTTVTIPSPTGVADVQVLENTTGTPLSGTNVRVYNGQNVGGILLNSTTAPAVTYDVAGFHISANGAAYGAAIPLFVQHVPSGQSTQMTGNVGAKIVGVVGATLTP